jgi:Xaa-Pro aminopeptidase
MLQSFDETARPAQGPPRLAALREVMRHEGLAGYLVPRADAHQGEYVAPHDERLAWLTGFTGSAGFCAVLMDAAGVFIDGRYRTQIKAQVATDHFTPVPWPETALHDWLRGALPDGGVVGFDPWLHTVEAMRKLATGLEGTGITLRPTPALVDGIWHDQPPPPQGAIAPYPEKLAGEAQTDKRSRLAAALRNAGQRAAVLTLPDSIAWLFNIRGSDIPRNPVPHCFAILHDSGRATLFAAPAKCNDALRAHLGEQVTLRPDTAFGAALRSLQGPVRIDPASCPVQVGAQLQEAAIAIAEATDPCVLPKACKNSAEIAGARAAHLRDGAAVVEFLCWYDGQDATRLTEIDLVTRLEQCRRDTDALRDISFDTIAGSGPNGAVIHYHVTRSSNRALQAGDLVVLDSGGQYLDGTTDITRTLPVGTPDESRRTAFTRVLRGMIALSRLRFPPGAAGAHIDAIARAPLWLAGQDYDHGTGHGVGAYLCVHEGPQRISRLSDQPLKPGMIVSNEPGYYREGAFGIRIENLIAVREAAPLPDGDAREMLDFETLTLVPIDRRLIVPEMLAEEERAWLDAYHAQCRAALSERLSPAARAWLLDATAPL